MDSLIVSMMVEDSLQSSNLEQELMKYDAYAEWCNSPSTSYYMSPDFTQHYVDNTVIPRPLKRSLDEKMLRALQLFKEWSGEGILVQVWVPMKNGDHYILSTCEQPYLVDQSLCGYREVSRLFTFGAESKGDALPGLPGRVFNSRMPEWTSNVMYYNETEYLRVQYAADHEIRGSIALPVFEDDFIERSCCAVLELVTTKEKPDFDLEMENVCRALQAVDLSSALPPRLPPQSLSNNQRAALAEIKDVLRAVSHAHQLPLALTWIPCNYTEDETVQVNVRGQNARGKSILCIEETACYWNDERVHGFVHACGGHFLEEGEGIVGKALQSNEPFFYHDVKEFDISEYPLVHHARKFGLSAAVAIRVRSSYTGDDDYILELFLPVNMKGSSEQQLLLNNLSSTMQRMWRSLRKVSLDGQVNEKSRVIENFNFRDGGRENPYESKTADVKAEQTMVGVRREVEKKRTTAEKHISLRVLQQYFSGSLKDAAKSLRICPTTLKRICRHHGILRWPSRKINKVNRSLKKIQSMIDSVEGLNFDPVTGGLVASSSIIQEIHPGNSFTFPGNSINFDVVNVKMEHTNPLDVNTTKSHFISRDDIESNSKEHAIMDRDEGGVEHSQSTSSGVTDSSNGSGFGSMMNGSSSSSGSLCEKTPPKIEAISYGDSLNKIVVKAIYREDTIRFKFDSTSGCFELYEEVAKRFKLEIGRFQLKYRDDEEEWVMLVNDSDLHECRDILDYLGTRTVKFMVCDVPSVHHGALVYQR